MSEFLTQLLTDCFFTWAIGFGAGLTLNLMKRIYDWIG